VETLTDCSTSTRAHDPLKSQGHQILGKMKPHVVGVCVFWRSGFVSPMGREKWEWTDRRTTTVAHASKHTTLEDVYSKTRKDFWHNLKGFSQLVPASMTEIRYQYSWSSGPKRFNPTSYR